MANRKLNLGSRLQGSEPFLEIQSVNSDNFVFDANSTLNLADSLTVQDITVNGTFTNAGGGSIGGATAEYTTSITTPKIIFTDNQSAGLTIEAGDGADFMTFDSTNGSEHIDILKDTNTGGNKLTMGTNGSRGIIQYGDIRNSTIGDTNTLSANTTGTAASWTTARTISFRNAANGNAAMGSVSVQGTGDVNADIDILDQTNSNAHKFIFANTNTGHTDTNLQQRIDFLNAQDSNITRSDNLVGRIASSNDNMFFIIPDKSHASNSSQLQLTKNKADDIPTINQFLVFDTMSDGDRVMNIQNENTTYDGTTAQRQYRTSIFLGNNGHYSDSVVGDTIAKVKANWRDTGEGQLELLARRTVSSAPHECGFLITSNSGGGTALDVPVVGTEMVMKGQKLGAIHDVDYFNGMKVGHAAMVGNGLQILTSGGGVVSGAPSAYGNAIHPKLKSGGGLAVDGDGLYVSSGGEWASTGSGNQIIASPHTLIGLSADNLTGSRLLGFSGTDSTLKSSFNHFFGAMDNDNTNAVNAGITIVGYNEGTGNNVGGHSQLVLQNAHTESTDGLCDEIGVFRLENEGDLLIQQGKKQETNTDQIYNGANGAVNNRLSFLREGRTLMQLGAFAGTDNVLTNYLANNLRNGSAADKFALYSPSDNFTFEMCLGKNNLASGSDVDGTSISTPSGFQISHQTTGLTMFNNNKLGAITFQQGTNERMRVTTSGRLAIGLTSADAPLHVGTGVQGTGRGSARYFGNGDTSLAFDSDIDSDAVSIQATSGIMTGTFFLATSDSRIKQDVEDIGDTEALELINRLQPRKYNYIDPLRRESTKTIGFIAQEVREVIPNAVKEKQEYIPDILLELDSPVWDGDKLVYDMSFGENETGWVRFIVEKNDVEMDIYLEYSDGGFMFEEQYSRVFIYGRQINDMHTVIKDKIFAVNVSATQELSRKVSLLETENTGLQERTQQAEQRITTLETENNGLLEMNGTQEQQISDLMTRVASLETLLQSLTNRVVINETTLQGLIINN